MHRFAQGLALCCVVALLCGCHRHDDATAAKNAPAPKTPPAKAQTGKPPATSVAKTPAPAPASSTAKAVDANVFHVSSLALGTAIDTGYAVTASATRFSADTHTIYASVATSGRTAGAKLDARWRYLEGQGVLVNELSQNVVTDGSAVTTFEVQNPNRWPAGKYVVEISLDGKPVAQQAFEVTDGK
ncbi:hypothetical protein [Rhodanobacter sp. DHG33]|uniref:hypothetical protein n=1 Tax=Rhodanobacter sp. DHG33 TaxID=2775921 RepID=UPI00178423E9|nr:hypothetical protein [Rhodanobacter sp. DHG33]MBD8897890.1 hypothetical protein [Rhodanobacter sp. DHG33]